MGACRHAASGRNRRRRLGDSGSRGGSRVGSGHRSARGTVERDTYDAVAKAYGEGYNAPIAVLADIVQSQDPIGLVKTLSEKIGKLDGVERVALATPNRDGSLAFVQIIPTGGQTSKATADLVKEIRGLAPSWGSNTGSPTSW